MKNIFLSTWMVVLMVIGCTKKPVTKIEEARSPEIIIRKFVDLSVQAKEMSDKNRLGELCSGELKAAFDQMNDEQFKLFYLNGNIAIQDFKILANNREGNKAKILYQVTVENRQGTDVTKEVNEREVDMIETPSGWLIEGVRPKGLDKLVFSRGMIF